jgi:hypothetical protein
MRGEGRDQTYMCTFIRHGSPPGHMARRQRRVSEPAGRSASGSDARLSRRARTRVRSHCRFRNRGTEYVRDFGIKWMSSSTKRRCDRALARTPGSEVGLEVDFLRGEQRGVDCPGPELSEMAVKRPARPYKSAIQNRFVIQNAKER